MARTPSPAVRRLGALLLIAIAAQQCSAQYYGKLIGKLSSFHHGVSGEVYAVDARTLFIKDFNYDGEAPAAWFYAGNSKTIGVNGFKIRDEQGTLNPLRRYRKKDVTLTLPEGKTLNNIKWFSIWCEEFAVNFGDVKIPRNFEHPRPQKLAGLAGVHGVSSEPVVVVDAQTLLLPSFSYDGEAPDAKFWVGSGPSPSPQGIRVPDENGKEVPLRRYERKTIVLTLPGELTIHQLGHFGVWCEAFAVDFGHIQIPQSLNVPPSLKMLGVSPQNGRVNLVEILTPNNNNNVETTRNRAQEATQQLHARQFLQQYDLRPTTYRPVLQRRTEAPAVQVIPALDYQPQQLYTADGLVTRLHQLRANVQDDGELVGYVAPLSQKRFQGGLIKPAQAHARFQQIQDGHRLEAYHVQY